MDLIRFIICVVRTSLIPHVHIYSFQNDNIQSSSISKSVYEYVPQGGRSTMREGSSTSPQSGKVVAAIDLGTTCVRSANSLHTLGDNRQTADMYYRKHEGKWKVQGWG